MTGTVALAGHMCRLESEVDILKLCAIRLIEVGDGHWLDALDVALSVKNNLAFAQANVVVWQIRGCERKGVALLEVDIVRVAFAKHLRDVQI